jgi:hypothetical protein
MQFFLIKNATETILLNNVRKVGELLISRVKGKAVPLHAMEALGRRGGIAPTHSRPRH